jgi:hypothetical protein
MIDTKEGEEREGTIEREGEETRRATGLAVDFHFGQSRAGRQTIVVIGIGTAVAAVVIGGGARRGGGGRGGSLIAAFAFERSGAKSGRTTTATGARATGTGSTTGAARDAAHDIHQNGGGVRHGFGVAVGGALQGPQIGRAGHILIAVAVHIAFTVRVRICTPDRHPHRQPTTRERGSAAQAQGPG